MSERPARPHRRAPTSEFERLVRERWRDPSGIRGLSVEMGVSRATLYSWLNGQTAPDTAALTRLARLLGTPPSELLMAIGGSAGDAMLEDRILGRAARSWRADADVRPSPFPASPMLASEIVQPRVRYQRGINPDVGMVETCMAAEPIGPVAWRMYERNFSQLPVLDGRTVIGLLTGETIARWMADQSAGRGSDLRTPVREVMTYAETPDNYRIVSRGTPPGKMLELFDDAAAHGIPLAAVLTTADGSAESPIISIHTSADIPQLRSQSR